MSFVRTRSLLSRLGLLEKYDHLVSSQAKHLNTEQRKVVVQLDRLRSSLLHPTPASRSVPPRSLYLHGGVGVGKTMLMDLFSESLRSDSFPSVVSKRVHFHAFLQDLHVMLHKVRSSSSSSSVDYSILLRRVLDDLLTAPDQRQDSTTVLCFDEFHIADIADGMLLYRIFDKLLSSSSSFSSSRRFVLVVTSNREPSTLYENGINRQLILPFIQLINDKFDVLRLESAVDYRESPPSASVPPSSVSAAADPLLSFPSYSSPASSAGARELFQKHFHLLASSRLSPSSSPVSPIKHHQIPVVSFNRSLTVPLSYPAAKVAYFSYSELCQSNLSYVDYLAVLKAFDILFVDGVPPFDPQKKEEGRRFINVVDCFYDAGKELIILGEQDGLGGVKSLSSLDARAPSPTVPDESIKSMRVSGSGGSSGRSTTMFGETEWSATGLYGRALADVTAGGVSDVQFSSDRTISRLCEMGGTAYKLKNRERWRG